jgi:hypothetical protein
MLERHSALVSRTSRRFASLSECCKFVTEELTGLPSQPASQPQPRAVPSPVIFTPAASRVVQKILARPNSPLSSFVSFWNSDDTGDVAGLRRAHLFRWTIKRAFARG